MCEVFFDTVLLCPLTALAILVKCPDIPTHTSGMSLVLSTVGATLGRISSTLVLVCITSFAFSTVICWYCYGSRCLSFLGVNATVPYMLIYVGATLLGVPFSDRLLIFLTDHVLMALSLITLVAIIKNSDRLCRLSENSGLLRNTK
jgi:AGCS family alanine or glycine:cation symporter